MAQLYEAVLESEVNGKQHLNVFNFYVSSPGMWASGVAAATILRLLEMRDVWNTSQRGYQIRVRGLDVGGESQITDVSAITGTVTGNDALPIGSQASFAFACPGPTITRGGKRISGVAESLQSSGEIVPASMGLFSAISDILVDILEDDAAGIIIQPVVTRFLGPSAGFLVTPILAAAFKRLSTIYRRQDNPAVGSGSSFTASLPLLDASTVEGIAGSLNDLGNWWDVKASEDARLLQVETVIGA